MTAVSRYPICGNCYIVMTDARQYLPVYSADTDTTRPLFKYTMAREYVCCNCAHRVLLAQNDIMGAATENPIRVNSASLVLSIDEKIVYEFRAWVQLAAFLRKRGYVAAMTRLSCGTLKCSSTWGDNYIATLAWRIGDNLVEYKGDGVRLRGLMVLNECDEEPCGAWQATWAREEWILRIFNTHRPQNHRVLIGYDLTDMGELVFSGNSAYLSATDSYPLGHERVALELLEFLAMEKMDTEDSYFDDYTPLQIAWRDQRAADLKECVYDRSEEIDRIEEAAEEAEKVSTRAELARSKASSGTRAPRGIRLRPPK